MDFENDPVHSGGTATHGSPGEVALTLTEEGGRRWILHIGRAKLRVAVAFLTGGASVQYDWTHER